MHAANTASEGASPSTSPAQQSLPADQAATTGEEGETVLYEADGTLFQFHEDTKTWRERGRGELRVNKAPSGQSVPCVAVVCDISQDFLDASTAEGFSTL